MFPGQERREAEMPAHLPAALSNERNAPGQARADQGVAAELPEAEDKIGNRSEKDRLLENFAQATLANIRIECVALMNNNREFINGNVGLAGQDRPDEAQVQWNSAAKDRNMAAMVAELKERVENGIKFLHAHFPNILEPNGADGLSAQAKKYLNALADVAADLEKPNLGRGEIMNIAKAADTRLEPYVSVDFKLHRKHSS